MKKRFLSVLTALALCLTLLPTAALAAETTAERHRNPKRVQREIRRALTPAGIGTKAQQALGLQREQGKAARRVQTRAEREREQARQFQLRQTKRKEKHRGH